MLANRFQAFKVSRCGNQHQRDHVRGLTLDQARDPIAFPLGPQRDERGAFVWSYSLDATAARA
jgi:hypothetical protein